MDFTLDKKHEMARSLFKEFAETEVKPLAQETDETEAFPAETVKKMQKYGFMGIPVPKEYGGQGCDPLTYVMCVEELSKVCATTGVVVSAHTSLCIDPIMTYGTEEQKQKYVKPLATGEKLGAFALTEPGAGTDAQGAQTKAVFDGAKEGDAYCMEVVEKFGRYLGVALSNVAHVVDPEAFVIGGGVSAAGQILLDVVEKYYNENSMFALKNKSFHLAELGNDAGIYGAVRMVLFK